MQYKGINLKVVLFVFYNNDFGSYLVAQISEETLLTLKTVNEILVRSGCLEDFLNNPEAFLEQVTETINFYRHQLAIDGIRYIKLDGEEYYVQEIFDSAEFIANLDKNAVKVEHSVYDYVVYDSSLVEKPFALALDHDPDVKMFFKIPSRFQVDTPIGTYTMKAIKVATVGDSDSIKVGDTAIAIGNALGYGQSVTRLYNRQ